MSFTQFLSQEFLNHLFTDPVFSPPAALHIGLSTTTPGEDGTNFTEQGASNGYVRISTVAGEWGPATNADPSSKSNTTELTFPQATGDWLTGTDFTHFGIFDATTGGNLLAFGVLGVAKPVLDGDTAKFPIGDLDITLQ